MRFPTNPFPPKRLSENKQWQPTPPCKRQNGHQQVLGAKFPTSPGTQGRPSRHDTTALAAKRSRQQPQLSLLTTSPWSGAGTVDLEPSQKRKPPFLIRVLARFQEETNDTFFLLSCTYPLAISPKPQKQRCRSKPSSISQIPEIQSNTHCPEGSTPCASAELSSQRTSLATRLPALSFSPPFPSQMHSFLELLQRPWAGP